MKTKMNINKIAKMSFASFSMIVLSAVATVNASNSEVRSASERLESLNSKVEESMKFKAPAVSEDIEAYEVSAAFERLENLNLSVEEFMRYNASPVAETEDIELADAKERLDNLSLIAEQSSKYSVQTYEL